MNSGSGGASPESVVFFLDIVKNHLPLASRYRENLLGKFSRKASGLIQLNPFFAASPKKGISFIKRRGEDFLRPSVPQDKLTGLFLLRINPIFLDLLQPLISRSRFAATLLSLNCSQYNSSPPCWRIRFFKSVVIPA